MINLYIDGKKADFNTNQEISLTLALKDMEDIDRTRAAYTKNFSIPATTLNKEILGYYGDVNISGGFVYTARIAIIEKEGSVLLSGMLYINGYIYNGGDSYFEVCMIGPGKQWATYAATTSFRNIGLGFEETITSAVISQSWSWEKPVRYLPVKRSWFTVENVNNTFIPPAKILTFEDYHPFINVNDLIRKIFSNAGYSIESGFFETDYFRSLYVSGNYPSKNVDSLKSRMDFLAGRFEAVSAKADWLGNVYANPYVSTSTIGNIVETADPNEEKNGVKLDNVFSYNDCFRYDEEMIMFIPPAEVTVGFEYSIRYTTDYYMLSREELKGFNTVSLGDGQLRKFKIANRNGDRRSDFRSNRSYKLVIFDFNSSNTYQLRYLQHSGSAAAEQIYGTISSRSQEVAVITSATISEPALWYRPSGSSAFVRYTDDWALYDGFVEESGTVDVEILVRSTPEVVTPTNPKYFAVVYFSGAEAGMNLTLHRQTTLRPFFGQYPSEGSSVKFSDVAAHSITALDFVNGIKRMFNLCFYTDDIAKKVFIEPYDDFYNDNIVDLTDRIDLGRNIKISDLSGDALGSYTLKYSSGDGTVAGFNAANHDDFGKWTVQTGNDAYVSNKTYTNIFTPSLNAVKVYPDALDASMLLVGDSEDSSYDERDNINFPIKIVRYMGMQDLPDGQFWGWPTNLKQYPLIAFHNPDSGEEIFTLCYEDRDGQVGLHRHYDNVFNMYKESCRIQAYIYLKSSEIEKISGSDPRGMDFRAIYKLRIRGEEIYARLEEIADYSSGDSIALCSFIKIVK